MCQKATALKKKTASQENEKSTQEQHRATGLDRFEVEDDFTIVFNVKDNA